MTAHFNPTLLLNADFTPLSYFPLSTLSWQDAIKGIELGKYTVVAEYDDIVRSPSVEMFVPSVVALKEYQRADKRIAFTRFNLFLRDRFTCQYCNTRFHSSDLTFEHVVPRKLGGKTTWTNIVAACVPCNSAKADKLDMKPRCEPIQPTVHQLAAAGKLFPPNFLHESWTDYLYWDTPLEP